MTTCGFRPWGRPWLINKDEEMFHSKMLAFLTNVGTQHHSNSCDLFGILYSKKKMNEIFKARTKVKQPNQSDFSRYGNENETKVGIFNCFSFQPGHKSNHSYYREKKKSYDRHYISNVYKVYKKLKSGEKI
jgi:hypothetical protein